MTVKSKLAAAGMIGGGALLVWHWAQEEATNPGAPETRTESFFNAVSGQTSKLAPGLHNGVIVPSGQIAGEVGAVAGTVGGAAGAAGGAVAENAVPEAPKAGGG